MSYSKNKTIYYYGFLLALLLVSCDSKQASRASTSVANPASDYCVKKGGKLEFVKEESGEKGICHLPEGTVIEEWELFRKDNPQK